MKKFFETEAVIFSTGGGEKGRYQDTVRNIRHAIDRGADVVRSNVSMTMDNKIVLYSDIAFKNKPMFEQGISAMELGRLREMHAGFIRDGVGDDSPDDAEGLFPELSDVLAKFPSQRFNLNFPDASTETAESAAGVIAGMKADDRVLASAVNSGVIKRMRTLLPGMPTSFSFSAIVGFYALYRSGFLYFKKKFLPDALIMHEMIGGSYLGSQGMIAEAVKRGIAVYFLNVSTEDQVRRLREAGATGFVTGDIEIVKGALSGMQ